ncbi:hypothetical protein QYE76_041029 [Lolium multiflorum]|uniref:Uncharacterized protein n=1 Tax=Lolium multiflorum TaxID=4521 RepID=A0AAD8TD04_LOLMU|nr:hypothetical protein QYE76_041029 [Lolium multiflorum]
MSLLVVHFEIINELGMGIGILNLLMRFKKNFNAIGIPLDANAFIELRAVLQLLDAEKEDGGLNLVVMEQLVEDGIVRARRIGQIYVDELIGRAHR